MSFLTVGCQQGLLTQAEAQAAYKAYDYRRAMPSLVNHAKAGDVIAMRMLAKAYMAGLGVDLNLQIAAAWYFKAASMGDRQAQVVLAGLYETGTGVDVDVKQFQYWLERAAVQGDQTAARKLYQLLLKRKDSKSRAQGFAWLKALAENGNMAAMARLSELLEKNKDPKLVRSAIKWKLRAAEAGDSDSQYQLAIYYSQPEKDKPNYFKAWLWFDRAARQGDGRALVGLAGLMIYGLGRSTDLSSANALYLLALERGYARAQEGISLLSNRLTDDQQEKAKQLQVIYGQRYPVS